MTAEVREASYEEGAGILDRAARRHLGMSGEAFLERWDANQLTWDSAPGVTSVAMLIPFARANASPGATL